MLSGEKILFASIGIAAVIKEKAQRKINVLIQKGGYSKGNSEKIIRELIAKGEEQKDVLTKIAQAKKSFLKNRLQFASKEDISRIEKILEDIRQKLK